MSSLQRKYNVNKLLNLTLESDTLTDLNITDSDYKFKIVPFTLLYGAINATEAGYKPYNAKPTDYTTFSRVFSGKEAVIVEWDNSIVLTPDVANNKWTKKLQIGTSFDGYMSDNSASVNFSPSSIDGSFIQESNARTFTFKVSEFPTLQDDFTWKNVSRPFTNDDLFKFYQILEVDKTTPISQQIKGDFNKTNRTNRQYFYISNATNYYSNRKEYVYSTLTFTSVNDKIEKSGFAIDQYIHNGGVGEGTAFPTLDANGDVSLDKDAMRDTPITHVQVDYFGNVGTSNVVFHGRPANANQILANKYTQDIVAPRPLFFWKFLPPIQDPLKYNNTPSRNLAIMTGGANYFDINSAYGDWKTNMSTALYNNLQQKEFEGSIGSDATATNKTFLDTTDNTKPYVSAYWNSDWTFSLSGKYDTKANPYFSHPISSKENLNPTPEIDYANIVRMNLPKLFMLNYFLNIHQEVLPKDVRETTFYTLTSLPVVGGYLNNIIGGLPFGFRSVNNSVWPKTPPLNIAVDGTLYNYVQKTLYNNTSAPGWMPVDLFRDDDTNEIAGLLGSNATTISYNGSLTDKVTANSYNLTTKAKVSRLIIDTSQLAQSPLISGTPDKTRIMLLDNEIELSEKDDTNPGYLIDAIEFKVIGKVDYKITFYSGEPKPDNSNAVWMGYYSTYAKQTKNINNWTNRLVLSNYSLADKYRGSNVVFKYPQDIIFPVAPTKSIFTWEPKDANFDFNYVNQPNDRVAYIDDNTRVANIPSNTNGTLNIQLPNFLQSELNAGKVATIQILSNIIIAGGGIFASGSSLSPFRIKIIDLGKTSAVIPIDPKAFSTELDIGVPKRWLVEPVVEVSRGDSNIQGLLLFKDASDELWKIGFNTNWNTQFKWINGQPSQVYDYAILSTLSVNILLSEIIITYKP